jgi:hypothetical protein
MLRRRSAGLLVSALVAAAAWGASAGTADATSRFPPGYGAYHTYAEMAAEVASIAAAHPDLVKRFSIGRSAEGRQLWAVRVSQDVRVDHRRPEILFDGLHHGLEHVSLEMTLAIFHWLVDGYGHDGQVTALLRERVVDIVFAVNPDGAEYDIQGGVFHGWRKNRQPTPGSSSIGTDLNRNYGDHWACCGLVSRSPASAFYAGPAPFSAPETRAMRDFIESRVVDGRQRITVAVTFHTSGRLILWPFGYTKRAIPPDMTPDDHAVFVALARAMAARNGYKPEQASSLYVDSGTARDWEYGRQHIFAFTFELGTGQYPSAAAIGPETARNRGAILYLIGIAGCPYRVIGKAPTYCKGPASAPAGELTGGGSLHAARSVNPARFSRVGTGTLGIRPRATRGGRAPAPRSPPGMVPGHGATSRAQCRSGRRAWHRTGRHRRRP